VQHVFGLKWRVSLPRLSRSCMLARCQIADERSLAAGTPEKGVVKASETLLAEGCCFCCVCVVCSATPCLVMAALLRWTITGETCALTRSSAQKVRRPQCVFRAARHAVVRARLMSILHVHNTLSLAHRVHAMFSC
jgi:hypothetical protein